MENRSLNIVVLVTVALVGLAGNAQAACGDCLGNGVACINATSFQLCLGAQRDQRDESQTMTCPEGQVCTGLQTICISAATMTPACDDQVGCGVCASLGGFSCLSKTRFALCVEGQVTGVQGKCPEGSICEASSSTTGVCVDQCGGVPTCNVDDPK